MAQVSVREFRDHLTRYLRGLKGGGELTVTRHGRPVAVLSAIADGESAVEALRPLVAGGLVSWAGRAPAMPRRRVALKGTGPTVSEMVLEDRR